MPPITTPDRHLVAKHRDAVLRIANKHGASNVRLFGSVARNEARIGSDIDLLVSVEPGRSMTDLVRLQLDLEDLFGVKVDVVQEAALHPALRSQVIGEAGAV